MTLRSLCVGVASLLALGIDGARAQAITGVAAGDPTSTSVTLWVRAIDPAVPGPVALTLEVALDEAFATGLRTITAVTEATRDATARVLVEGLTPGTRYHYRFRAGAETGPTATFRTAPADDADAPVWFAFSGDCDGEMRPYPLASAFPALGLDFFVFLGDTIYEVANARSAACAATGSLPGPSLAGATPEQLASDYARKYVEQLLPMSPGGQPGLLPLFTAQANYTMFDNHELGNRQYAEGGAPAGGPLATMPSGAGVDARDPGNDENAIGPFQNKSLGFATLTETFFDHHPIADRGLLVAPGDPRSAGTRQFFTAQRWGRHAMLFLVDDRSYRDIRMKNATNGDDTTAPRADAPGRTMLGAHQLAWLQQQLLAARDAGVTWKFVAMSTPIDQIVALGATHDGGKWIGGYRAERNALLTFLADHHIDNVVFLATDDHQSRINEVTYSPSGQTAVQATYVRVPRCFSIVCGPIGAHGPEGQASHEFAALDAFATQVAAGQAFAGIDPIGLAPDYPGLRDVVREGHPAADLERRAIDFFSNDTFSFTTLQVSGDGATLSVELVGMLPTVGNTFPEHDPVANPIHRILGFEIDAYVPCGAAACGQRNSDCATLRVDGIGSGRQGPIGVAVPMGGTLSLEVLGQASQPFALFAAPTLRVGQRLFGGLVAADLDVGSAAMLFDPADALLGPALVTDATGHAALQVVVPAALHGLRLHAHAVLHDPAHRCSAVGFATTAAFTIDL